MNQRLGQQHTSSRRAGIKGWRATAVDEAKGTAGDRGRTKGNGRKPKMEEGSVRSGSPTWNPAAATTGREIMASYPSGLE